MSRVLVGLLLLLGGLIGLGMTACGAFISVAFLAEKASRQYAGVLVISLPCLLLGLLLLWFVWRKFRAWRTPPPPPLA